jgi:hypothetical protein
LIDAIRRTEHDLRYQPYLVVQAAVKHVDGWGWEGENQWVQFQHWQPTFDLYPRCLDYDRRVYLTIDELYYDEGMRVRVGAIPSDYFKDGLFHTIEVMFIGMEDACPPCA